MHWPFLRRLFALFLPMAAVLLSAASALYFNEAERKQAELAGTEHTALRIGTETIASILQNVNRDLLYISRQASLRDAIDAPDDVHLARLTGDWVEFSRAKKFYDQIRWLDETGMERIRINYAPGNPVTVPQNALQNKGKRYFFIDAIKLNTGEIFVSPLDLNIEGNQIEVPYKPMIRVGTPVFDGSGRKRGIALLNYDGRYLLGRFEQVTTHAGRHAWLLNRDGFWLKGPQPDDEWGFMLKREDLTLARRHPEAWKKILAEQKGQFETAEGLWTFETISPLIEGQKTSTGSSEVFAASRSQLESRQYFWKAVSLLPAAEYHAATRLFAAKVTAATSLLLALLLGGCWLLVRSRIAAEEAQAEKNAQTDLRRINQELEQRVAERTRDLEKQIKERKTAEDRLRLAAQVFDSAGEGIVITDADNNIIAVNQAFTQINGYSQEEVIGKNPSILSSGRQDRQFYVKMWNSILSTGHWQGELWNRRKNGEIYPEWLAISIVGDAQGELTHYIGIFTDITERKSTDERLRFLAHNDPLTGLPNRLLLKTRLDFALSMAERAQKSVALLFLDLDRFKTINDSLGHHVGDALLQEAARRLRGCLRDEDTVSRQGGDEFLIVLPDAKDMSDTAIVAQKIVEFMTEPFSINGLELSVSASIGISLYPQDGKDAETLIKNADAAMYHAKHKGRNNYQFFTGAMNASALEHLSIGNSLRHAITRQEFFLAYQPQIDLASGKVIGAEALIRWRHPQKGMISPTKFIPIAEEHGSIITIGEWVLREACAQNCRWQKAGLPAIPVAVNLSAFQFRQHNLAETIARILDETGLDPHYLELELTESLLMEEAEVTIEAISKLKSLDLKLSIDDFGTGYSSLSYLKRFAIDKLKIDRSFVRDIPGATDDNAIVAAIITLAKSLDLTVIAEGVETQEQFDFLSALNCDQIQGYYFSKPVTGSEFTEFLAR
ncbi:MAG: EAL domain-containing protein [Pseudomonadota bacterium]|jgi:diguanylate cyclase (GGDEF)-like protein/PAS domain S-box-containing protein